MLKVIRNGFSWFFEETGCVFAGLIFRSWESQNSFMAQKLAVRFSATTDSVGFAVARVVPSAKWKINEVQCFRKFSDKNIE